MEAANPRNLSGHDLTRVRGPAKTHREMDRTGARPGRTARLMARIALPIVAQLEESGAEVDAELLTEIAERTGGRYFEADTPEELAAVYEEIVSQFSDLPEEMRKRIHLVSLPMDDLEENAFMVNAIQRRATVIVQKSLAEGYGLTVSEGMWKSRPMVASRIGGIRDQIEDGRSGILIDDARDLPAFAAAIDRLLADGDEAQRIGDAAHEAVKSGSLSVQRLVRHYELLVGLS